MTSLDIVKALILQTAPGPFQTPVTVGTLTQSVLNALQTEDESASTEEIWVCIKDLMVRGKLERLPRSKGDLVGFGFVLRLSEEGADSRPIPGLTPQEAAKFSHCVGVMACKRCGSFNTATSGEAVSIVLQVLCRDCGLLANARIKRERSGKEWKKLREEQSLDGLTNAELLLMISRAGKVPTNYNNREALLKQAKATLQPKRRGRKKRGL
jgi:hypothetical protein